jgi:hypothetical protein
VLFLVREHFTSTPNQWTNPIANRPKPNHQRRWEIPAGTPAGTYRVRHFGAHKTLWVGVREYDGTSGEFVVTGDEVRGAGRKQWDER